MAIRNCFIQKFVKGVTNAAQGAFLPVKERDLYSLGPQSTVLREFDPTYQGHVFPDFSLEEPDLESIMGELVPQKIQIMILTAARQSHTSNQEMVQLLDSKIRSLYTAASGLVNDRVETLRGFGRVQNALDICQQ